MNCRKKKKTESGCISRKRKAIELRLAKVLTFVLAVSFAAAFVYGQEVHYNYEHGANFSTYKTYQWVDAPADTSKVDPASAPKSDAERHPQDLPALPNLPAPPELPAPPAFPVGGAPNFPGGASDIRDNSSEDQLINQEIKRAVDEQLAQKGLTRVDRNADLQVGYHAATHQEVNLNLFGSGWGGRGYGGPWDGSVTGQTSTISVGTLVVDLYDPARKQLVWRGDATKTIDLKKDPDKNYRNLQKAMAKLFKNYPPQPKK